MLSGHCAKLLAPSVGSNTLLDEAHGMPARSQSGCRKAGTITSSSLDALSGTGSLVASALTAHGLLVLVTAGAEVDVRVLDCYDLSVFEC